MVREVNGPGATPPATPAANEQSALRTQRESTAQAAGRAGASQPPAARAATDSVNLSSSAVALKAVEERIQKLPEVNEKRVAEIKAALASGTYKVDDLVIADKLLAIDDLFEGERPE